MNKTETIIVDVYPWAEPTEEQKRHFDSLPQDEKHRMIEEAIREGIESGPAEKNDSESFIAEAKARRSNGL